MPGRKNMPFRIGESYTEKTVRAAPDHAVVIMHHRTQGLRTNLPKVVREETVKGNTTLVAATYRAHYDESNWTVEQKWDAATSLALASTVSGDNLRKQGYVGAVKDAERQTKMFQRDAGRFYRKMQRGPIFGKLRAGRNG